MDSDLIEKERFILFDKIISDSEKMTFIETFDTLLLNLS